MSIAMGGTKSHSAVDEELCPTLTADSEYTKYVPIVFADASKGRNDNMDDINGLDPEETVGSIELLGCCQNTGQGWWNQTDVGETLRTTTSGDATKANLVVYAVHEADKQNVTLQRETAYSLTVGGEAGTKLSSGSDCKK